MQDTLVTKKLPLFLRMVFSIFDFIIEYLTKVLIKFYKENKTVQILTPLRSNDYLLLSTPIIRECIIQAYLWPIEACYVAIENVQRDLDRTFKVKMSTLETKRRKHLTVEHGYWSGMITYTALQFFSLMNYYSDDKKRLFFAGVSSKHQLLQYLRAFQNLIPDEAEYYRMWLIQKGVESTDSEMRIFFRYHQTKNDFKFIIDEAFGYVNEKEIVAEVKEIDAPLSTEEIKL